MDTAWNQCPGKDCISIRNPINQAITIGGSNTIARGLARSLSSVFSPNLSPAVSLRMSRNITSRRQDLAKAVRGLAEHTLGLGTHINIIESTHPHCLKIREVLIGYNLKPVYSHLVVGCCDLRLATCLDLLCRDITGNLVVVLLKYGYDDYYDVQNQGHMKAPFDDVPSSFLNRHLVELLVAIWLFNHSNHIFSNERIDSGRILRVYKNDQDELTTELNELPSEWICDSIKKQACLATLRSLKTQTSKDRASILTYGMARGKFQYVRSQILQRRGAIRREKKKSTSRFLSNRSIQFELGRKRRIL